MMDSYRGSSLIRNCPPPYDHRRALGIVFLLDPSRRQFLMSEVPLYRESSTSTLAEAEIERTADKLATRK